MKVVDNTRFYERIKNFFALNWWLVWGGYIALFVIIYMTMNQIKQQNAYTQELLAKEVQGVVFLGQNGQPIFGEKTLIDASTDSRFRAAIKNNLMFYLVTDGQRLTNNYRIPTDQVSGSLLYSNIPAFSEFYENFVSNNLEKYPRAQGSFNMVMNGFAQAIRNQSLADLVVPIDSTVQTYTWDGQKQEFEIVVNVLASVGVYNAVKNTYDKKQGTIQIRASGYFDLVNNSTINPLGIKYFDLGITNASK